MTEREEGAKPDRVNRVDAQRGGWNELLVDVGRVLQESEAEIHSALDTVAQRVVSLTADGCAILLEDAEQLQLVPAAIQHRDPAAAAHLHAIISQLTISTADPRLARLHQQTLPIHITDLNQCRLALEDVPLTGDYLRRFGLSGLLVTSLRSHGRPCGILALWRDGDGVSYTDDERTMTHLLAGQLSLAIGDFATRDTLVRVERERDIATALLDSVLDTAPIGFAFHDTTLRLQRVNKQLSAIHRLAPGDAAGSHSGNQLADLEPDALSQLQQVLDSGSPLVDIATSEPTSAEPGLTRHWRVSHYPVRLPDGELLGVSAIVTDVTAQRVASDELRESLKLVGQLAEAEQTARREAEQAATIRDNFLSIASHELKTPLTTIKATAQLLDRRIHQPTIDVERVQRHAALLQREINRLATLVDDLLNATHIQRGRLTLRPERVDLVDLTRQALARFEYAPERTERHNIRFIAPEHLPAVLDPGRIDQVLTNLISNALKYSPDGGEVRVVVQKAGEQAEITIVDHGMGMTREEQGKLFQPFTRSAIIRQTIGGSGLGLYIAARIVEQHHGTITVESEPDTGSVFQVHLPLVASADEAIGNRQ